MLLAFDGALRLNKCCATPANRVRKPTVEDIVDWLDRHPGAWDAIHQRCFCQCPCECQGDCHRRVG